MILFALIDDTGFQRCALPMPTDKIAPRAFFWFQILFRIFGKFPVVDLMTPTCSAEVVKLILWELTERGDDDEKYSVKIEREVGR